jgi:hypothetical protein
VVGGDPLDRFTNARQQVDRVLQRGTPDFDHAMQVPRTDALTGHLDGGLQHRERHALHAVTEDLQVAALDVQQVLMRARIREIHVRTEDRLEVGFRLPVVVLALPQRVVAVETDPSDARHRMLSFHVPRRPRRIPAALARHEKRPPCEGRPSASTVSEDGISVSHRNSAAVRCHRPAEA